LLEIIELASGDYHFFSDGREVRPVTKRFGVFYPPFTFVRVFARSLKGRLSGVGSTAWDPRLPSIPLVFETDFRGEFASIDQAVSIVGSSGNSRSIVVNSQPSAVSLEAKRLIDDNYLIFPAIGRIAERLKISHEHLSRCIKKDYGVSPSEYLHRLRVAEATFRLSTGEEIIDISMDVGYNDLSRFYKQFRKATHTSPAACRRILKTDLTSKNAKTGTLAND
jgi:AraC-like DNA-binding protein